MNLPETATVAEPAVGFKPRPMWQHEMPSASWQLLWWLISRMDEKHEVRGGWRVHAAGALKKDRTWISRCAEELEKRRLVATEKNARWVRVIVENFVG